MNSKRFEWLAESGFAGRIGIIQHRRWVWNILINDRSRGGGHAKMSRRAETTLFPIKGDLPFVYRD